ncbi:HD phosphohydrolase domain-containing protein [Piptocephalis cylindrospora]|uniref:HD phosphohydrolase domain-containing protein n=1 Tax=Piptocephalis cylindrospora TaxID=1907219 RepID=A0A4P9Y4U8_9FUNG|nr:HD phosphohydrolase domain-containing protein [Piptocephalis cylindrospora]|eukprot:RKP13824.1 HD phosphohydrolase domain-containing protein [Piptocephalis cylindrospora]
MENPDWQFEKVVGDPIHKYIRLDDLCWDVVDTEEFQRLRDLKQLGSAYYVFPGASHNRFEHSIGVSYLAGKTVERFKNRQPGLELTEGDVRCVRIAGLCHDIGHGPFSHVFDNEFIPRARPGVSWSHEEGSEMMLEYLVEENNIDLDAEDVRFIKALISGVPSHAEQRDGKRFLFDIVANKRNGIDVDKLDYLARDCHYLGEQAGYDGQRLLEFSEVRDDQVCYYHKEVYNIYELFNTRYSLFKRIYCHRVGKAIEYMITDALLAADPVLGISDAIGRPDQYKQLTDTVLRQIEFSKDEALASSRDIIRRIRQRNLYRFVCEYLIPPNWMTHLTKEKINENAIIDHQPSGSHLNKEDVIVEWAKLNYGSGDKNPVDSVKFYSKHDHHEAFHISKERVSLLVPERYQEVIIRVYTRDTNKVRLDEESFMV